MSPVFKKLFLGFLLLISFNIINVNAKTDAATFKVSEDSILHLFQLIAKSESNDDKLAFNNNILSILKSLLVLQESFDYRFDTLKYIGRLYAPDKSFRIINWNIPLNNGTHQYFCFIQVPDKKQNTIKLLELNNRADDIPNPESAVLNSKNWYGSLYYKILKNKVQDQTYYTLLALQYHNIFITRKIIDVLQLDETGNLTFGAPIFQINNVLKKRIVFEFSAKVSMNLKYDENLKMIIFDHLIPSELKYTGQFEYYAPDMTFDGLKFEKDRWVYKANLDIRRPEDPRR